MGKGRLPYGCNVTRTRSWRFWLAAIGMVSWTVSVSVPSPLSMSVVGGSTSGVQVIHGEDRVNELARMLGDSEGTEARKHAQAMLKSVRSER